MIFSQDFIDDIKLYTQAKMYVSITSQSKSGSSQNNVSSFYRYLKTIQAWLGTLAASDSDTIPLLRQHTVELNT